MANVLANLSGISEEMAEEQLALLDTLSPLNIEALRGLSELETVSLSPGKRVEDWSAVDHVPNVMKG